MFPGFNLSRANISNIYLTIQFVFGPGKTMAIQFTGYDGILSLVSFETTFPIIFTLLL